MAEEHVSSPGDGALTADVAGGLAKQNERLLAVESLAQQVLDALRKATEAAGASQTEESEAAHRIGCLEKKQKSVQTQLDELSRFMIGLAGDHEMLEARTGDQLADLEARRQRLSLLLKQGAKQPATSDSGQSPTAHSSGNTAVLLQDIRDDIETFRGGLLNVGSQLEELSRATICLTGDHEVLEARMGDQIDSLEQGRRRLSMAVKALKWPESSGAADHRDSESLLEQMRSQLQEDLRQQAESWRSQFMLEFTAKQAVANLPKLAVPSLPAEILPTEKEQPTQSEEQLQALVDRASLKTREQNTMLELRIASAESQVNALEGLLQGFFERAATSADRKIEDLRAELLREHLDGLRADVDAMGQRVNMQVGNDATGSVAVSSELATLQGELQALQQEEGTRTSSFAELRAEIVQLAADRGQLAAAVQAEESARINAFAEVTAQLQEVAMQNTTLVPREGSPMNSPQGSCERELRSARDPLVQEISCLRTEVSALRAEQSFTAARAEGRYAALEAGLSDTRRIAVSSSAQATRRLDSFEAAATVNRRSLDIVMESQLQRTSADVALPHTVEPSDARLQAIVLRVSSLDALAHELKESADRQVSRLARSEEWLQSLVTKSSDADLRMQQLEKRLPKSLREAEEPLEEALAQLTTGVLKMAQLLGVASEDMCEKLGWRDACWDLPRMMDHAWLRSRLPKKASVIKILRQKADAEQLRQLQEQFEMASSFSGGGESGLRNWSARASPEDQLFKRPVAPAPDESQAPWTSMLGSSVDAGTLSEAVGRAPIGRVPGPRFGAGSAVYLASSDAAAMARNRARSAGVHRPAGSADATDVSYSGRSMMTPPSPKDDWADIRRSRDEPGTGTPGFKSSSRQPSPATNRVGESPRVRVGNVAPPRDAW